MRENINMPKINNDYKKWVIDLKERIRQSQIKAAVRINSSLIELYWSIGADIANRQAESKWGSGILMKLSKDLRAEFPNMQGFSERNLWYVKQFYLFYSQSNVVLLNNPNKYQADDQIAEKPSILHQLGAELKFPLILGQIPWRHHVEIISKCENVKEALFYINKTIENGWSRAMLINFMEVGLYNKQGKAINNFSKLLPNSQSDLARETLKDPYNFDFITLSEGYKERELEDALTSNITKFLLELGHGFAYVGRQVNINVGGEDIFIDLLFYHLELRCYVIIELKTVKFEAAHIGQLGLYVSAVNHQIKKETDNPTIGLLICQTKNNVMAKYSLESSRQPIGISEYKLSKILPKNFKSSLPSIAEIEKEIKKTSKKNKGR
ncbi:MAG: PDDEXK nuclease domain-containing protein [Elusimicrobiota bacterium]|nr:PDDEXK nuclease domain-containing protein [Elusimicrobiota bacterium]